MTIFDDQHWPHYLEEINNAFVNHGNPSFENRYYALYNRLLQYCFEHVPSTVVVPQSPPGELGPRQTLDFTVFSINTGSPIPMLFIEVKNDTVIMTPGGRSGADEQMRNRYRIMLITYQLYPRLWGLSCIGLATRFYFNEGSNLNPPRVLLPYPFRQHPRNYLQGQWDLHILDPEAFEFMRYVVVDIQEQLV